MRIVIELRRDANANVIMNQLYKHTQMQDTFGIIMLALVNNEPKVMNILDMLTNYLAHQEEVVTRRTKYDLNKAEERDHILQGLLIALLSSITIRIPSLSDSSRRSVIPSIFFNFTSSAIFSIRFALFTI